MTHLLAYATIAVGVPLNLYVTVRLWRLARSSPELRVIRDRAIVATLILILVAIFGFVFLNNDLANPPLSFEDTKVVTRLMVLALATVPATYWLWLYR